MQVKLLLNLLDVYKYKIISHTIMLFYLKKI